MKNIYLTATILILICTGLSGCNSALSGNVESRTARIPINTAVENDLIAAAKSVESSLALLASTQAQQNVPLLNTAPLITPEGGMSGTADIDWTGPIEPLLNKLAHMTDYKLKVLGAEPGIPIVISIAQNKAMIADILKNAGMQAGKRANIVVFPANRVIELRYASVGTNGG